VLGRVGGGKEVLEWCDTEDFGQRFLGGPGWQLELPVKLPRFSGQLNI